jgi:hypothetical protein
MRAESLAVFRMRGHVVRPVVQGGRLSLKSGVLGHECPTFRS